MVRRWRAVLYRARGAVSETTTKEKAMSDETKPAKPGYKTTEFWLTLLAMLLGALWGSGLVSDGSTFDKVLGFAAVVLGQLGYTVSRGLSKGKAQPQ
jgi:hypothetical protein